MKPFGPVLLLLWSLWPSGLDAAVSGWRGDGTGVFPDADPPVSWSEDEHIAWRAPLPNWGNGSPVVGGPNVYVLCEPTMATPAPILVAIDQASGAIRWQAPVDHFDAPGADSAARDRWHTLQRRGWGIMQNLVAYRAALQADDEQAAAQAVAAAKGLDARLEHKRNKRGHTEVQAHFDHRAIRAAAKELRQHGIRPLKWEIDILNPKMISKPARRDHTWCANWAGQTFCAPVADDDHVYVVTGRNAAACFAHDGTRRWLTWIEPRAGELQAADEDHQWGNGPILVDDRLVVYSGRSVHALDAASGRILWTVPLPAELAGVDGRSFTTIVPIRVGEATYGLLVLDKVYLFDLQDGRDLLADRKLASLGRAHSPGILGPIFCTNRGVETGGLACFRLQPTDQGVTATTLWSLPKGSYSRHSPTGWRDRFFTQCGTFDLDGKQIGKGSGGSRVAPILAGGRLYQISSGRDRGRTCTVVDAASGKRLAKNTLASSTPTGEHLDRVRAHAGDDRWYYFTMAVPLAHERTLYLRSMDHLYCIRK